MAVQKLTPLGGAAARMPQGGSDPSDAAGCRWRPPLHQRHLLRLHLCKAASQLDVVCSLQSPSRGHAAAHLSPSAQCGAWLLQRIQRIQSAHEPDHLSALTQLPLEALCSGNQDGLAAAAAQKRRFADGLAAELASVRQAASALRGSLQVHPVQYLAKSKCK